MMRTTVVVERAQLVARRRADGRHVYRKEGKAALVAACSAPGASVAAIALAHGVNANLLRKWITRSHTRDRAYPDQRTEALAVGRAAARSPASMSTHAAQFLAVELAPAPAAPAHVISAPGTISIQLGEARIEIGGVVEREALRRVIDCLRESTAVQPVRR
jgi:transposase